MEISSKDGKYTALWHNHAWIDYREDCYMPSHFCQQGRENPLEVYISLKDLSEEIAKELAVIQPMAVKEAEKYNGQVFGGKKIVRYEVSVYDFSGDAEWEQLKMQENKISEIRKQRETLLKDAARMVAQGAPLDSIIIHGEQITVPTFTKNTHLRLEKNGKE